MRKPRPGDPPPLDPVREVSRADSVGLGRKLPEQRPALRTPSFVTVGLTIAGALAAIVLLMYLLPPP